MELVGNANPGTFGVRGEMTRLLKATSSMTNKIAPSAERETRFTLTWFMGKGFRRLESGLVRGRVRVSISHYSTLRRCLASIIWA